MSMLQVGDIAPEFSINKQDGNAVSLQQHRGQNVLLWWYPKADTPG